MSMVTTTSTATTKSSSTSSIATSSSSTATIDDTIDASSTIIVDTASTSSTSSTTMVAFPVASPSTLPTAASTTSSDSSTSGLSKSAKDAVYATTIIGGTLLIALLIWLIHRRRVRRRTRERRRVQEELDATTSPRKRPPGFGDEDMMETQADAWYGQSQQPIPSGLAERFRRKDTYIKAALGEAYPMHADMKPEDRSQLLPTSPPPALTKIDEADNPNWDRYSDISMPEDGKVSPLPGQRTRQSDGVVASKHLKRPPPLHLDPPRWSWTNSQAPATPRMYVPTIASSRNSTTRFRMAVNWVKTRGERITSGEAPVPNSRMILPKAGVLKNQASKPNLAPKKLVKKNSVRRASALSGME